MQIEWPTAGKYLVAVSGGVDSVVLLDVLVTEMQSRKYEFIVAHFDHRMRPDSAVDAEFVADLAEAYGLPFLGGVAASDLSSEAEARSARYEFLHATRTSECADGVITGHHADDRIETSLLNLARGTGYRGLLPMQQSGLRRPLLPVSRQEILAYAERRELQWREDPSNQDRSNPRNFLRHELLPAAPKDWRQQYDQILKALAQVRHDIRSQLDHIIDTEITAEDGGYVMPRSLVQRLTLDELEELLAELCLRLAPGHELSVRLIQQAALFAKTAKPGRWYNLRPPLELRQRRSATVLTLHLLLN